MPRRRRLWPWFVALALSAGVAAYGVLAAGVVALAARPRGPATAARAGEGGGERAKRSWTRDEFREAVMGLTKDEVLALLGRPAETKEPGDGNYWIYRGVSVDPVSGKADAAAWVRFDSSDVVAAVDF